MNKSETQKEAELNAHKTVKWMENKIHQFASVLGDIASRGENAVEARRKEFERYYRLRLEEEKLIASED
jgi:hypothetical protein